MTFDTLNWPGGFFRMATFAAMLTSLAGCTEQNQASSATSSSSTRNVDWPAYNNTYDGQRFSTLGQINTQNVSNLKQVCELRLGEEGPFQTGPVVVGGTMFLTTAHTTVAMDATTCAVRWRHVDASGQQDPISVNRGVAYLDGRLFRGMPGARLASFNAETGEKVWDVKVGDVAVGEFLSSAPIARRGRVFVGLAGGDWGIRGRVMAFDAVTGEQRWRFYTIPLGPERGAETWHIPETAERGGGAMWTSYTLDPSSDELFVPVGNAAPDFAPDLRPGDNLFTNSIVVLDAMSGGLKWWFQATPHDGFDYDVGAAPMLYQTRSGEARVAIGSKDGHLYGVARQSHAQRFKTPITTILNDDKKPTLEGIRACPGPLGGVEWNGPAFDPDSRTIYVGSVDWCATFNLGQDVKYKAGELYMGTRYSGDNSENAKGWVTALDGDTGAVRWKFQAPTPVVAGVTPTAGGLVFTGDLDGNFYALAKANGQVLHMINTGGSIAGGVVTYMVNGKQYVATTSGNVSRLTFQTTGSPKVIVMAVDVPDNAPQTIVALPTVGSKGLVTAASTSQTEHGAQLFQQFCTGCHGTDGEGGAGPSLTSDSARRDIAAIAAFIKNPNPPMPKLYPAPMDEADVAAVASHVVSLRQASAQ
jgi:alcohol dehydrogenase (cytochrome c)